jgi:ribosomal protein L19E
MHGGHHHHGRRRGFRGYPNREQWIDRLEAYREHLEGELKNVQELLERLGDKPAPPETV